MVRLAIGAVILWLSLGSGPGFASDRESLIRELESSRFRYYDHPHEALQIYRQALERLSPEKDPLPWLHAAAYFNFANLAIGQMKEVAPLLEVALPLAKRHAPPALYALLLLNQLVLLNLTADVETIQKLAEQAYTRALEGGDLATVSESLQIQAMLAKRQGKFAEHADLMRQAYRVMNSAPRTVRYYATLNNLAWIAIDERTIRISEGVRMLEEVTAYTEEHGYRFLGVAAYYNYGLGLMYINNYEKSFQAFDRSATLAEEIGDQLGVAYAFAGQGYAMVRREKWREAIPLLRAARDIAQQFGDQEILFSIYKNLAKSLLETGQIIEARPIIENLEKRTDATKLQALTQEVWALQAQLFEKMGDFTAATSIYKKLSQTQKATFDSKSQELAGRYLVEFQVERRDERNALLTQETEIQQLEIQNQDRQNLILMISLIGSLGVGGIIGFDILQVRKRNREIQKLQAYIERNVLQRFLPPAIVQEVLEGVSRLEGGVRNERVTILFADLCDFTRATERLGPQTTAHILNDFFANMTDIVFDEGGTVDKFIGDAVMVIFGAPTTMDAETQAQRAVRCAQRMHERLSQLNETWQLSENIAFHMRIGIHQGPAVVGTFGGERRSDYTVVGTTVNLAARVENVAEARSIWVTSSVVRHLSPKSYRLRGRFPLRGLQDAVDLYEIIQPSQQEAPSKAS